MPIKFVWPDEDDPIFGPSFTVFSPIRGKKKPAARVTFHQPDPDDPMFGKTHVASANAPKPTDKETR